jgi:DNA-binding transcriptional MerR regulator
MDARLGAGKGTGETASAPGGPQAAPRPDASTTIYRTRDVVQILGISRRQLQYWAQTDLVVPSAKTRGGHHRYSFEDLVALKATKRLLDAGVSVQRIRSSIRALRRMLPRVTRPLAELTLVATGDVVLVFHEGSAFEAVTGQEWVFEVAQFEREISAWRAAGELAGRRTREAAKAKAGGVARRARRQESPRLEAAEAEPRSGGRTAMHSRRPNGE